MRKTDLLDPFETVLNQMNRFLSVDPYSGINKLVGPINTPALNVIDGADKVEVHVAVPGLNKEDISVKVKDGWLVVTGEKTKTKDEPKYDICEFNYSKFTRSVKLSDDVDHKKVDATFKNGILNITIPKTKDAPTTFQVEIK